MRYDEIVKHEGAVIAACRATVANMRDRLAERSLTCEQPELYICCADPQERCSEVRAMIVKDGQIVDVVEFFVFEEGQLVTTGETAATYVRSVLLDVLGDPSASSS